MVIELIAEITHHLLPDHIVQVGLPNTNNAGNDGHDEHDTYEDKQQVKVAFPNSIIKNELDQERVYKTQDCREDDCNQYKYNLKFIWAKSLCHAPDSS